MLRKTLQSATLKANSANYHKRNERADMTERERLSTGNYATDERLAPPANYYFDHVGEKQYSSASNTCRIFYFFRNKHSGFGNDCALLFGSPLYIYIYIFTNQLSTSIHGTRKKQKTPGQEQEIKISRITVQRKKKKFFG